MFTSQHYSGYSRSGILKPSTLRRTSKVKFNTEPKPKPTPKHRKSKKNSPRTPRTPRSNIIRYVKKGFKRLRRYDYDNQYIKNLAEFSDALSPFIIGLMVAALYSPDIFKKSSGPNPD